MKITVPVLMKDPAVVQYKDLELVRDFDAGEEEFLLDGPVSKRLMDAYIAEVGCDFVKQYLGRLR